jgi:hypothetical protein
MLDIARYSFCRIHVITIDVGREGIRKGLAQGRNQMRRQFSSLLEMEWER